jgi:hypothetical protein
LKTSQRKENKKRKRLEKKSFGNSESRIQNPAIGGWLLGRMTGERKTQAALGIGK